MEDDRSKNLRKLIQEVQQDKSLTPQEKARKIQRLMSGKPANEEKEKDTLSTLDISVTFRDQENNILGCKHYMRNAKIRAKCCGQLFSCRFCHDEKVHDHQINRFEVEEMFCMLCNNLGPIDKFCRTCMKEMGVYYCNVCKFIDNDPNKTIYHCTHCGICRIGKGLDIDYFHCMKCNACLAIGLKGNHKCIENNFKSNCPICRDDLFSSRESATVLNCGHSMHAKCYNRYVRTNFVCPLCHKSLGDMKDSWESLDQAIGAQPMPVEFANAKCMVLCNDCEQKTEAPYHFLGLKCQKEGCGSYNTNILSTSGFPDRSQLNLLVNNNNNNNNNNNSSDNNSNNNNSNNNENSNNTEIIIEDDSSDESDYEEYDDSNEEEETAPQ